MSVSSAELEAAGDSAPRGALGGSVEAAGWAVAMADLSLELHAGFPDSDTTINAVAALAVKVLPGITAAAVVRTGRGGALTCQAATNPQVLQMVQAEHRTGQGPCRSVLARTGPAKVVLDDVTGGLRWPAYLEEASSIGIAAVMAVRLDCGDHCTQALLLITDRTFHRRVVEGIDVFTTHAAVALAQSRSHTDLHAAVETRDVIGQAKGILMERHKITSGQAFRRLAKTSQDTNTLLGQVARQIAGTGEEPPRRA